MHYNLRLSRKKTTRNTGTSQKRLNIKLSEGLKIGDVSPKGTNAAQ